MQFQSAKIEEPHIELTPLIDVIFQLLLFFMVTTTFAAGPAMPGLDVDLPGSGAPRRVSQATDLVVVLAADGKILVGKELMDRSALLERFKAAHAQDARTKVVLQADKKAFHEDVVLILDAIRQANLAVAIATDVKARGSASSP